MAVWRLLAAVALAVALPLTVLVAITVRQLHVDAESDAIAEVSGQADFVAQRLDELANEVQSILGVMTRTMGSIPRRRDDVDSLLRAVNAQLPRYILNLGLYDLDGNNIAHSVASPASARPAVGDRRYFVNALATGRFAVGEPTVSRIDGRFVVGFAFPVRDDRDRIVAIATASSDLRTLVPELKLPPLPPGSVITILDTAGRVVARTLDSERWITRDVRDNASAAQLLRERNGEARLPGLDSVVRLAAYRATTSFPWIVLVATPADALAGAARDRTRRLVIAGAMTLLVGLLLSLHFARRIGRPIAELIDAAETLGDAGAPRPVAVRESGPLRPLALAFNRMVDELDARAAAVQAKQEALERTEFEYRLLFDQNPAPIFVFDDDSLRMLAVNEVALQQYGYTRDEFLALSVDDMRPPEDRALWRAQRARLAAASIRRAGIFRHVRKDGTVRMMDIVSQGIVYNGRPARLVIALDVTERLAAERALRESEAQYRLVTDGVPIMIAELDARGELRFVNRAFTEFFPVAADSVVGFPFDALLSPDVRAEFRQCFAAALTGAARQCEFDLEDATRRKARTIISFVPAGSEEPGESGARRVQRVLMMLTDISERMQLEAELRHVQKLEAIGQLAGGVAHDFNNLLTVILSHLALVSEEAGALPTDSRESLGHATTAARRAAELTRNLLSFARRQILSRHMLDVNDAVTQTATMLHRTLGDDIRIEVRCSESLWPAEADIGQVEQVLLNLAVNARDAMPRGGTLTIETANHRVDDGALHVFDALPGGDYVVISVSDTGVGIAPSLLPKIFEPFFTTKEVGHGTGLGLAVCYGIARQHGGDLTVYSEPGQGTTFRLYLPRSSHGTPTPAEANSAVARGGTETILLVEDADAVRAVAERILRTNGYTVLTASDGEEGLALSRRHAGRIDLLLTDMVMPRMGGRELATVLRQERPDIAVIFSSGYSSQVRAEELPGRFLAKPFVPAMLLREIRDVLDAAVVE